MPKNDFSFADLSEYAREVVDNDAVVLPLKRGDWAGVGDHRVFLLDVVFESEQFFIKVLVGRYRSLSGDLVVKREPVLVKGCHIIPGTNLIFDMWVDRGRSNLAVPLIVEKSFGKTTLEDLLYISTNLPNVVLEKLAKAIIGKKVVWNESKTNLVAEGCDGEFEFEGARYSFYEIMESPSSLHLVSGSRKFVDGLVEMLEKERLALLDKHNYSKAENIYHRIESLRKVLIVE